MIIAAYEDDGTIRGISSSWSSVCEVHKERAEEEPDVCTEEFSDYKDDVTNRLFKNHPVDDVKNITIIKTDRNFQPLDPNLNHWIGDWGNVPLATDEHVDLYHALFGCTGDFFP